MLGPFFHLSLIKIFVIVFTMTSLLFILSIDFYHLSDFNWLWVPQSLPQDNRRIIIFKLKMVLVPRISKSGIIFNVLVSSLTCRLWWNFIIYWLTAVIYEDQLLILSVKWLWVPSLLLVDSHIYFIQLFVLFCFQHHTSTENLNLRPDQSISR